MRRRFRGRWEPGLGLGLRRGMRECEGEENRDDARELPAKGI